MKYAVYALIIAGVIVAGMTMMETDAEKCSRLVMSNNIMEAVEPCKDSADRGSADSQYVLGVMYATGKGVARDEKEAASWYRKAAEQGHVPSQYNLGYAYHNAKGVPRDDKEAFKWYHDAAVLGHPEAQHNLGLAYLNGEGVLQDHAKAYAWFNIAASHGQQLAAKARDLMTNNLTPKQLDQAQIIIKDYQKANPTKPKTPADSK